MPSSTARRPAGAMGTVVGDVAGYYTALGVRLYRGHLTDEMECPGLR